MSTWALLAPGPSATSAAAERARTRGLSVGVVNNAFELAPWADFLAAADSAWWRAYPVALRFIGRKFAMHNVAGVERVTVTELNGCNSGVLALEVAKRLGATRIELYGFDLHGSHFFGQYANGLNNTSAAQRDRHIAQYRQWAKHNKDVDVINCTVGSALDCFRAAA